MLCLNLLLGQHQFQFTLHRGFSQITWIDSLSLNNVVGIIYFISVTKASNDLTLSHATSEIHEKCDMEPFQMFKIVKL